MKRLLALGILLLLAAPVSAYKIEYAEQWYKLVHDHLHQDPDATLENIYYLERALRADFANPLNALAPIRNEQEWARYRALFRMHVNLLLVKETLTLGAQFDKQNAYFFNYPWKSANLDSLTKAEQIYKNAFGYWKDAQTYSAEASNKPQMWLENLQFWTDEQYRIETGDLDYGRVIQKQLDRLAGVRAAFQAMGPGTY